MTSEGQIVLVSDLPACWPDYLLLNGLVYRQLEAALAAESRIAWLEKDSGYLPQPYERQPSAAKPTEAPNRSTPSSMSWTCCCPW